MDYKVGLGFGKVLGERGDEDGRLVVGMASIFGNVDSGGDIVHAGAFKKTLKERQQRVKHLWMHDPYLPPVAAITDLREVGEEELPEKVRDLYPEATGGLQVTREYLDTERGNEILEGIKAGAITEMSFAYDLVKWDFDEDEEVNNLRELRLWDTSDVTWGMNAATVAGKNCGFENADFRLVRLGAIIDEIKGDRGQGSRGEGHGVPGHGALPERFMELLDELEELLEAGAEPGGGDATEPLTHVWSVITRLEIAERELSVISNE